MSSLKKLLEEPFGPYPEEQVLTDAVGNTTIKNPVALDCLLMAQADGRVTGLSECEPFQPEYDPARYTDSPVRFTAVLVIQSLSWLTEEAVAHIEEELRYREHRARLQVNPDAARGHVYKLKSIYATASGFSSIKYKVKVRIMGTKPGPVVYPQSQYVRNGLMMNSANRRYVVESMHIHTYILSRRYLARYRLLYELWNLVAIAGRCDNWRDNKTTPLVQRTPEWFIDLYVAHMAKAGAARQHRPHYADSDTDIVSGSEGLMRLGREHTPRHVSRAEILSLIAQHSEWIVDDVVNRKQDKWIDVGVWRHWLADVRRIRKEAAKARPPRRWGVWKGSPVPFDSSDDEDAAQPPKRYPHKREAQRKKPLSPPNRTTQAASFPTVQAPLPDHGYCDRVYDSDFSAESSPAESDSDDSVSLPNDPDIASMLPAAFFRPPRLTATFKWVCDVERCNYQIDLHNLNDENLDTDEVSEEEKHLLRSKQWNISEPWAQNAICYMIGKHVYMHIDARGVKMEEVNGDWRASWKNPRHPYSEPLRKPPKDDRRARAQAKIKEETVED